MNLSRFVPLAAALLVPGLLAAQVRGVPVVNNGFSSGVSIAAEVGFANTAAGGGTAVAAHSAFGVGPLGLTASVSRSVPDVGKAIWAQGGAATFRIFGGPLVPFRVTAQAGAAVWDLGPETRQVHVPLSLGLSATLPNPAFAIRPWLAPRFDLVRSTVNSVGSSETNFAMSGGIELGFINGLRIRAAYDRIFRGDHPGILAFGLGYSFGG